MPFISDENLALLKLEMNFLMWTDDPPPMIGVAPVIQPETPHAPGIVNIQCVSHSYVCAALFSGYPLSLCRGKAFVADSEAGCLHEIGIHYWIAFENGGIVDFSLTGETGAPAILGKRAVPRNWQIGISEDVEEAKSWLCEPGQSVIYVPSSTEKLSIAQIKSWMNHPFAGPTKVGMYLPLGKIWMHCHRFLKGETQSLIRKKQRDAWWTLAAWEPPR